MPAWDALADAVARARSLIAAAAPDAQTLAEGEAYVSRLVASALADATLGHLLREEGLSRPLPVRGGPNPDYIMRHAPVDAAQRYRLEGCLNHSERIGVGLYAFGANGAPLERGYKVFDTSNCGENGRFTLTIGAGVAAPDALAIEPGARVLLIRILHRDAGAEPARLRLVGGVPARGLSLATGANDGALIMVARSVENSVREYLKWTTAVLAHPNAFAPAPPELAATVQADPDTAYYLGGFMVGDDEWLEIIMPPAIKGYWSVHAYNYWFEHLQTPGVHDRNAKPDSDGRIRIALGASAPATMINRIDTLGVRRGALICRIIGASGCPETILHGR